MEGESVHAGLHWGEGRREGVPEASGDGPGPIDMTKFWKRIGAEGAELRREDIQAVPVICITSEVRASDNPGLFEKNTE